MVETLSSTVAFSTPFLSTLVGLFLMSQLMVVETSSGSKTPSAYVTGVVTLVMS